MSCVGMLLDESSESDDIDGMERNWDETAAACHTTTVWKMRAKLFTDEGLSW